MKAAIVLLADRAVQNTARQMSIGLAGLMAALGISKLARAGAGAVCAYIGDPSADFFTAHVPGVPGRGCVLLFGIYGLLFLFSILAWIKEPAVDGVP